MCRPGEDTGRGEIGPAGRLADHRLIPGVRNAVHALFQHYRPYGDAYAYISQWMAEHVAMGRRPWVPLIVNLPPAEQTLRRDWGFPEGAVVLAEEPSSHSS